MIAVCIATYNQETFLTQAIESVLAQQCDEPLHIYIGDDASTDGTSAICERYAKQDERIVYIRRKENLGLVSNTIDLYCRIIADNCDFIAMLDGDDYWIDNHKLQKQLNYLCKHPECGFVHTEALEERNGQQHKLPKENIPTGDLSLRYDLRGARQTNSTVLFCTDLLNTKELRAIEAQQFPVLDYPLYGLLAHHTEFGYLPSPTAVWRRHNSVSQPQTLHTRIHYQRERLRMWKWLDKQYEGHFHFRWYKAFLWYIWQFFYILFAQIKKMLYLCSRF